MLPAIVVRGADLVARSGAMREVAGFLDRVAPAAANILITGEPGTGKSLVARLLHKASRRSSGPFVEVRAGDHSDHGFGLAIFGGVTDAPNVRRAGGLELARGGTLVLDEAADIPLVHHGRLLAALESGEFIGDGHPAPLRCDVRVVSLTTIDLAAQVARGRFNRELLMRLGPATIHVPPLRDRRDDMPVLTDRFLASHAERCRKRVDGVHPDALRALLAYDWPGNVRELDRTIATAVAHARDTILVPDDFRFRSRVERSPRLDDMTLAEAEQFLLKRALVRAGYHTGRAAAALGLSHPELQRRRLRHGI